MKRRIEKGAALTCAQVGPGNAPGSLGAAHNRRHDLAQLGLEHPITPRREDPRAAVGRERGQRGAAGGVPRLVGGVPCDRERLLQNFVIHGDHQVAPACTCTVGHNAMVLCCWAGNA